MKRTGGYEWLFVKLAAVLKQDPSEALTYHTENILVQVVISESAALKDGVSVHQDRDRAKLPCVGV